MPQPPQSYDTRVEIMDISDEEEQGAPRSGSPEVLEENEAERSCEMVGGRWWRLRRSCHLASGAERRVRIQGAIVVNATSEFYSMLGETPTNQLAGNLEEQKELMDFECNKERSASGSSESD